jgi:hypothetical protein
MNEVKKGVPRRRIRLAGIGLLILLTVVVSACVKVEMVPETEEQKSDASEVRGKDFRARWIERFNRSTVGQQADMIRNTVDSVSAIYLDYGYRVAQDWRRSQDQTGRVISASDIQASVDGGTGSMKPQFDAYEDAVAYGLEDLRRFSDLDGASLDLLEEDINLFREIRSAVFKPSGSPEEYEKGLDQLKLSLEGLSRNILDDLQKYL